MSHLNCKKCGYKQHDSETVKVFMDKPENKDVEPHDIEYICGACQDAIAEDYVYEIVDKDENVIGNGYVCLETAIKYAESNGGVMINQVWYPLGADGMVDYGQEVIAAECVWNDLPLVEILAMRNHPEGGETAKALFEQQKAARQHRIERNKNIPTPAGLHACKYCGKWADGKDPDILCPDCQQTFGHRYFSEL